MDKIIHEPARLRIMANLYRARDASFTSLRDAAELTDGNFAAHMAKLVAAEYVGVRRVIQGDRFVQRYQISVQGSAAFRSYLVELQRVLRESEGG